MIGFLCTSGYEPSTFYIYLERISDHGVSIGGSAVFLVTGERIEDAMKQYTDRELGEE